MKKIIDELTPDIIEIKGQKFPIKRLPLRRIFKFVSLIQDFFGEAYEASQGKLPAEVIAQIRAVPTDLPSDERTAKINTIVAEHLATADNGVTAILKAMLMQEDAAYELIALCLNPNLDGPNAEERREVPTPAQIDFVADNVYLSDAVKIVVTVIKSELTEDFFGNIQEGQTVLRQAGVFGTDTAETDEPPTNTNGSGSLSPNLVVDGSDTPIRLSS
jgi:hypothetical protein